MLHVPRNDFYDVADFFSGEDATAVDYESGGVRRHIRVIFNNRSAPSQMADGTFQNAGPNALCMTRDVYDANNDATLTVEGVSYYVIGVEPEGQGFTRLRLSLDQVVKE
jgi:hypothetical protein